MEKLKGYGMEMITPSNGYLACGDTGAGKMPEPETLFEAIVKALAPKDLAGKKVLVTAGPTQEKMDPVRYISNHSTGKMGPYYPAQWDSHTFSYSWPVQKSSGTGRREA